MKCNYYFGLYDKFKVLEQIKYPKTEVEISKYFRISQTQVSNINRNAQKILEKWKFGNLILLISTINYETEKSLVQNIFIGNMNAFINF